MHILFLHYLYISNRPTPHMTQRKIPTGSKILDRMLQGGYESDVITTLYGPAGSGKTILCMLAAVTMARSGKKVIYIDTENNFSTERLKQIAPYDYNKILKQIAFLRPVTFDEQKDMFTKLTKLINKGIGLVIIDTIAMLYRIALGNETNPFAINKALGTQLALINEITRKKYIPVLLANHSYADFDDKTKVVALGGEILRYSSKCLIELASTPEGNRKAILRKHRSIAEETEITFKIVEAGVLGTKESKGFKLF